MYSAYHFISKLMKGKATSTCILCIIVLPEFRIDNENYFQAAIVLPNANTRLLV